MTMGSVLLRYGLQRFWGGFVSILAVFVGLFLLLDGMEQLRRLAHVQITTWSDLPLLMLLRMPGFLLQFLPPVALLTTLLVVTRMSRDSEITAMRVGGLSSMALVLPFALAGLLLAIGHGVLLDRVVPSAQRTAEQMMQQLRQGGNAGEAGTFTHGRAVWLRDRDQIIHARYVSAEHRALFDVTLFRIQDGILRTRMDARRMEYADGSWQLLEGVQYRFGQQSAVEQFSRLAWPLELDPALLDRSSLKPSGLSLRGLVVYAQRLQREGYDATRYDLEFHRRLSAPVTTLVSVLIAFPFALRIHRFGNVRRSLFIGIMAGFALYGMTDLFVTLGENSRLSPLLAAWTPVMLCASLALFLLLRMDEGVG